MINYLNISPYSSSRDSLKSPLIDVDDAVLANWDKQYDSPNTIDILKSTLGVTKLVVASDGRMTLQNLS
jgi:hypothetical protein